MAVLAGDIGGTHTRLALLEERGREFHILTAAVYPSRGHRSLAELLSLFMDEGGYSCEAACLGVAGPVRRGRAHATNLPWEVEAREVSRRLDAPAWVINDLEATAWSIPILGPDQVATLKDGRSDKEGNGAIIAPGTGLGEAGLFWDGSMLHPFPSEGGHNGFAPVNEREWGLHTALAAQFGHVSWERVVSGPGLISIHRYLADRARVGPPPPCPLHTSFGEEPEPPAITRAARAGVCAVCVETMEQFCRSLGAKAGDLALTLLATRGVWIAGGIAPDALDLLRRGAFLEGFMSKGRLSGVVGEIPVYVILNEQAPLLGSARCAFHRLRAS
jgi:glucokinase